MLHVVNLDHTLLLSSNSHFLWNRLGLRWLFLCLFLSICLRLGVLLSLLLPLFFFFFRLGCFLISQFLGSCFLLGFLFFLLCGGFLCLFLIRLLFFLQCLAILRGLAVSLQLFQSILLILDGLGILFLLAHLCLLFPSTFLLCELGR